MPAVPPDLLLYVAVGLFGATIGSFLNVCIFRLPLGKSIVRPGSHCPSCRQPIRWYCNVPVVSWIFLRGRCADCSAGISARYPFVEALTGGVLLTLWLAYGVSPRFAVASMFALSLLVLFFTDLDHQLLPDAITLVGTGVGLALAWINPFLNGSDWERIWAALGGAALGSGLLWSFGWLYTKVRGVEAMGMGDVKMMAMVGAFTGPFGVLITIFAASLIGALIGIILIPLRGRSLQDTLPFGCFLAPAAMASLVAGQKIAAAYLRVLMPPG